MKLKAFIYLPGQRASLPHIGKVYIYDQAFKKHILRPRGAKEARIYNLEDEKDRTAFHMELEEAILSAPGKLPRAPLPFIFDQVPLAAIRKPAAPAPAPAAPAASAPAPAASAWTVVPVHDPEATDKVLGYALARTGSTGAVVYRGLEDIWSETLPTDPFATQEEAAVHIPAPPAPPKPAAPKPAIKKAAAPAKKTTAKKAAAPPKAGQKRPAA